MKNSSLIKLPIAGLLCLAAACGESHTLEPDDFEQLEESAQADSGPAVRRDAGGGDVLGGLLESGALDGLLEGILGGGATGGRDAGPGGNRDAGAGGNRDAGAPSMALDGGVAAVCERFPQLPFCPRDAGAQDAGRDGAVSDASLGDAAPADASSDAQLEAGSGDGSAGDAGDAAP